MTKLVGNSRGSKMSKSWDEREKSLENEYFHRKEQELLEKLRAKRAEKEQSEKPVIDCPRCDGKLVEHTFEDVQIDRCNKCNGIWLDAGELELLTVKQQHNEGALTRLWKSIAGD